MARALRPACPPSTRSQFVQVGWKPAPQSVATNDNKMSKTSGAWGGRKREFSATRRAAKCVPYDLRVSAIEIVLLARHL